MTRIAVLIIFVIISTVEMPQVVIGDDSKSASKHDEEMLISQIKQFLSTWLVDRDFAKAIDSFGIRAFSNKAIFNDECFYMADEVRNSAEAMKAGIEILFKETNDEFPVFADLDAALNMNNGFLLAKFKRLKSRADNPVDRDEFLLVPVKASDVVNLNSVNRTRKFLKEYFKLSQSLYLSIIPIGNDDGLMCFIWEKDGENWKISHAFLPFCM